MLWAAGGLLTNNCGLICGPSNSGEGCGPNYYVARRGGLLLEGGLRAKMWQNVYGLRANLLRCRAGCGPGFGTIWGWVRASISSPPRAFVCTKAKTRGYTGTFWVLHKGLVVVIHYILEQLLSRLLHTNMH